MPRIIPLREMTEAEQEELTRISRSRTASKRDSDRARIILLRAAGERTGQIMTELGCTAETVSRWVKRFNAEGLSGLQDRPGRGRKPGYNDAIRGRIIAVARTHPDALDQAYGYWSLRRLADYLAEEEDIQVSKSHLRRVLEQEGLRWYQEKTYFTERPDPDFAEKRGR